MIVFITWFCTTSRVKSTENLGEGQYRSLTNTVSSTTVKLPHRHENDTSTNGGGSRALKSTILLQRKEKVLTIVMYYKLWFILS